MKILYVCTANICRSPFAEYYMRHLVDRLGRGGIEVASAGVNGRHGNPADPMMARLARERGIDLSDHRSKPLDDALVASADEIVVMERRHRAQILERHPDVARRVSLLRRDDDQRDLPDPIGGSELDYRRCLDVISRCVETMALTLKYPV